MTLNLRKHLSSVESLLRRSLLLFVAVALCAGGTGCSKVRRRHFIAQANKDFEAQQYDRAEIEYRSALQIPPPNPLAIRQLGLVYFEEGKTSDAYRLLSRAAQIEPQNPEVQQKLALILLGGGKYAEARAAAEKTLQLRPGDEQALEVLIDTIKSAKDIPVVAQEVQALRAKDTDRAGYHMVAGMLDFFQNKTSDADAELRKAIAMNPKSAGSYGALASVFLREKQIPQAVESMKSAAQLSPLRSTRRIRLAELQIQTGATNEARQTLEAITGKAPDYIPAWVALLKLDLSEHKFDEAANAIQTILSRDRVNFDALLEDGNLNLIKGDGAAAAAKFERMAELFKTSPQVRVQLALAYLQSGNKVRASASLNQALKLDPNFSPAILILSELDIRQNRPGEAVKLLLPLTKMQPQLIKAKMLLATAYVASQNPGGALAIYNQLAESYPRDPQIPLLAGTILEMQGNLPEARKQFEKSFELAPTFLQALERLNDLDLAEKKYDAALARLDGLEQKYPKSAVLWMLKASVFVAQNNLDKAETALQTAIQLAPDVPGPYEQLTKVYVASGRYQQALDRLNQLVTKTNDLTAWLQIGEIHDQLKEYDAARDAYEKTLEFASNSSVALNNLAYLYCEHYNDQEKALKLATRAREIAPYSPTAADTLGWVLFREGQYPRALASLQDAAQGRPADPVVQFHLAMAHYMMGEEVAARVGFQRTLSSKQNFPEKEEAGRRLAVLNIDPARDGAGAELKKILQTDPSDPIALARLGATEERSGNFEQAGKTFENILAKNPKDLEALVRLAALYSGPLKNPQKAMELAKTAHSLAPDDVEVLQVLGPLAFQTGDRAWALSLLQEAVRGTPGSPDLLYDLAWAYYASGDVSQAETTMRQAMQTSGTFPRKADAQQFLSMVSAAANPSSLETASAQASQILQSNARYVPALMVEALLQDQKGNLPQAQQYCDKALEVYPEFLPATRLSGILAFKRGDYVKSEDLLRRGGTLFSSDPEVNFYLGKDYLQLKRTNDCRQTLQRVVNLNPTSRFATEAKAELGKLK
jgi:tetratricopeptide (TPR) repeat protein